MKRCALLLAFAAALSAGNARKFTGVIHDNRCVGPACATQCPVNKDPVYTLQTSDSAWVLSDSKPGSRLAAQYLATFAGKKVTITGTTQGNRLSVSSVTAANEQ